MKKKVSDKRLEDEKAALSQSADGDGKHEITNQDETTRAQLNSFRIASWFPLSLQISVLNFKSRIIF